MQQAELIPQPGQLVGGKYRMIRVLGRGAMGAVYEARHVATGKRVAIKWLHPHVMQSRSAVERLVREAQAAARVRHSNVVDVYDVEREGSALFLVMEYLEGEVLSALLTRGGVPLHELIGLIVGAMRGVGEAHRQGIVHRDIKPDNIFLAYEPDQPRPVAKVLDFGISKLDTPDDKLSLTQTGSTLGTPLYMSYEQLSGVRDVDGRSDIYSFGVILYEVLTGRLPFEADNFADLAAKVITSEPVPPRHIRPDIPEMLEQIVLRAMRKRREERPSTMAALVEALLPYTSPNEGRVSLSSPSLSSSGLAASRVRTSRPVSSTPPPSLPLSSAPPPAFQGSRDNLSALLEHERRSQREMEARVTSLVSGTLHDDPLFPRKRPNPNRGAWMAIGAMLTVAGGIAIGTVMRKDASGHPRTHTPPPAVPAPQVQVPATPPAPSAAPAAAQAPTGAVAAPAPAEEPPEETAPTQVASMVVPPVAEAARDAGSPSTPIPPAAAGKTPLAPAASKTAPAPTAGRSPRPSSPPLTNFVWHPSGEESTASAPAAPLPPPSAPAPEHPVARDPNSPPPNPFVEDNPYPAADDELRYRAGKPREDEF